MRCPKCKSGSLRVKATRYDTLFVACTGFPSCKNTMSIPQRGITDLQLLEKTCKSCSSPRLPVNKLQVSFDKEIMDENIARLEVLNADSAKAV